MALGDEKHEQTDKTQANAENIFGPTAFRTKQIKQG